MAESSSFWEEPQGEAIFFVPIVEGERAGHLIEVTLSLSTAGTPETELVLDDEGDAVNLFGTRQEDFRQFLSTHFPIAGTWTLKARWRGTGEPDSITGDSWQVPFYYGAQALRYGLIVRPDVVLTGEVLEDEALHGVKGVPAKAEAALRIGVTHFFAAKGSDVPNGMATLAHVRDLAPLYADYFGRRVTPGDERGKDQRESDRLACSQVAHLFQELNRGDTFNKLDRGLPWPRLRRLARSFPEAPWWANPKAAKATKRTWKRALEVLVLSACDHVEKSENALLTTSAGESGFHIELRGAEPSLIAMVWATYFKLRQQRPEPVLLQLFGDAPLGGYNRDNPSQDDRLWCVSLGLPGPARRPRDIHFSFSGVAQSNLIFEAPQELRRNAPPAAGLAHYPDGHLPLPSPQEEVFQDFLDEGSGHLALEEGGAHTENVRLRLHRWLDRVSPSPVRAIIGPPTPEDFQGGTEGFVFVDATALDKPRETLQELVRANPSARFVLGIKSASDLPEVFREIRHAGFWDIIEPIDFGGFPRRLLDDFTGREWAVQKVRSWLRESRERAFFVVGNMGTGKSALMAHLADSLEGVAHHYCRADNSSWVDGGTFVKSIAAQLASQNPNFRRELQKVSPDRLPEGQDYTPRNLFRFLVLDPLSKAGIPDDAPLVILVDSLEESKDDQPSVLPLVWSCLDPGSLKLPLRWILSIRRDERFRAFPGNPLEAGSPTTLSLDPPDLPITEDFIREDLREYFGKKFRSEPGGKREEFLKKIQFNFQVATHVAREYATQEGMGLPDISRAHDHIEPYYLDFFRKKWQEREKDEREVEEQLRPLLEVLLAAQDPLDKASLGILLEKAYLDNILTKLSHLVPISGGKPIFCHASLRAWLASERSIPYRMDPSRGHQKLANYFEEELAEAVGMTSTDGSAKSAGISDGWAKAEMPRPLKEYALRYWPTHLVAVALAAQRKKDKQLRWTQVNDLLTGFPFLRARMDAGLIEETRRDFEEAAKHAPDAQ